MRMQVSKHRLYVAPLTLVSLLSACAADRPQASADSCKPGEIHCVCDDDAGCSPGLSCVAGRCVELPGGEGGPGENDEVATQKDGTSGNAPSGSPNQTGPMPENSSTGAQDSQEPTGSGDTSSATSPDLDSTPSQGGTSSQEQPDPAELFACRDGTRNHRETDIDCGGPVCGRCVLGQHCRGGVDCDSEVCINGVCVVCEDHSQCDDTNACTADRCENHACKHIPKAQGAVCDDEDPCTAKDRCQASGACQGENTLVIDEHFDNNRFRWRGMYANRENDARGLWKLGTARASDCGGLTGEDPAQDHTQNGKNGVAGVVVGGCNARAGELRVWDCLWSKDFEVYRFDEPVIVSFWRHLHTPASGSQGVVHRIVWRDTDAPNDIRDLYRGFSNPVNDHGWVLEEYEIPARVRQAIGVGICYQKLPGAPSFAGWTIDDFKIRQRGCFPDG